MAERCYVADGVLSSSVSVMSGVGYRNDFISGQSSTANQSVVSRFHELCREAATVTSVLTGQPRSTNSVFRTTYFYDARRCSATPSQHFILPQICLSPNLYSWCVLLCNAVFTSPLSFSGARGRARLEESWD